MVRTLLRAFLFLTPIAAVLVVLVRYIWDGVSTGAAINPWVLLFGSVLGWAGVQFSLIKFVRALGFEDDVWLGKKRRTDDQENAPQGDGARSP